MESNLIYILLALALAASFFALGVSWYPKLKEEKQGYPLEAEIEEKLVPLIYQAICGAYRTSERAVDELHSRLEGADKKEIADSIYGMLPDKIGEYDLTLVKTIVPPERFEQLVQDAFDRFDRFFIEHQTHFDNLFEEWAKENAPGS